MKLFTSIIASILLTEYTSADSNAGGHLYQRMIDYLTIGDNNNNGEPSTPEQAFDALPDDPYFSSYYNYTNGDSNYYNETDDYSYYNVYNFFPDGLISQNCDATSKLAIANNQIMDAYFETFVGTTYEGNTIEYCQNGACDQFEKTCKQYGGKFVSVSYDLGGELCPGISYRNEPICLGWDCDVREVGSVVKYFAEMEAEFQGQAGQCVAKNIEYTPHDSTIDFYPEDASLQCFEDMVNIFGLSFVYNSDVFQNITLGASDVSEEDYDMLEGICESSGGIIANGSMKSENTECTYFSDKPVCVAPMCTTSGAINTINYFFNTVNIFAEPEICGTFSATLDSFDNAIVTNEEAPLPAEPTLPEGVEVAVEPKPEIPVDPVPEEPKPEAPIDPVPDVPNNIEHGDPIVIDEEETFVVIPKPPVVEPKPDSPVIKDDNSSSEQKVYDPFGKPKSLKSSKKTKSSKSSKSMQVKSSKSRKSASVRTS